MTTTKTARKPRATKAESVPIDPVSTAITAYKGFNKDFCCTPSMKRFQYEDGKTYTEDTARLCGTGFHACTEPLDVFTYYSPSANSRYAEVLLDGVSDQRESDSKRVGSTITIVREISLSELILVQIAMCAKSATGETATGDHSQAGATGYNSQAGATGDNSQAGATGDHSQAGATGYNSQAGATGYHSQAGATGDNSKAGATGYNSQAGATGDHSQAGATGDHSQAGATGYHSKAGATGYNSQAGATGNYSQAGATGYHSQAGATGNYSQAGATGDYSQAGATGDYSKASCDTNGFACVVGVGGNVKGKKGSALSLGYKDDAGRNRIAVAYVGEDNILPDTWYRAMPDGTMVKV